MSKRCKRIVKAAALILLAVILVDLAATEMVYAGVFARFDEPADCPADVIDAVNAIGYEELSFASRGSKIAARLYRPQSEENNALILLIPGVHAGMDDHLPVILELISRGYAVLSFDPSGCRQSEGQNAGGFLHTVYDTEACLELIRERGLFGCESLYILGHSRGGYAACFAMANAPEVKAAAVISVPDNAMDAVIGSAVPMVGKAAAYSNYPMLWFTQALLYGPGRVTESASELINKSGKPALIIQGEDDRYYTPELYSLYSKRALISSGSAQYLLLPGGHADLMFDESGHASQEFIDAVDSFFTECLTGARSGQG